MLHYYLKLRCTPALCETESVLMANNNYFVKKWSNVFLHLYLMAKGKLHLVKFSVLDGYVSSCWCWLGNWVRCVESHIRSTRPSQALGTQKTLCNSSPTDCPTSWRSSYWILMITVLWYLEQAYKFYILKKTQEQKNLIIQGKNSITQQKNSRI